MPNGYCHTPIEPLWGHDHPDLETGAKFKPWPDLRLSCIGVRRSSLLVDIFAGARIRHAGRFCRSCQALLVHYSSGRISSIANPLCRQYRCSVGRLRNHRNKFNQPASRFISRAGRPPAAFNSLWTVLVEHLTVALTHQKPHLQTFLLAFTRVFGI